MRTEILQPTAENLIRAGELIRRGELVAFPTETVYGLGANGLNVSACRKIYVAKGRPENKPLTLHVADFTQIAELAEISATAGKLIKKFCPGPLTLILPRKDIVPDFVTGGLGGVGIRFPDNKIAQELIKISGCPIAAPSANISGEVAPVTAREVFNGLNGKVQIILDGGKCAVGVSSTVIDITAGLRILRRGTISISEIETCLSN